VSDEVFADYALPSAPADRARTALEATGSLVFALGGLSKQAALPQMKLAWTGIGGPDALVREALARLELLGDSFLSTSTPVQVALPRLLESRTVATNAIASRVQKNLAAVDARVVGSAVTRLTVEGGWYATLRLPRTRSEEAWTLTFLKEDGVYVHPGQFFDFEDEAFVVVSLLTTESVLADGIERIARRVG
jgi:aspartate/methionine/tyrosine aminotransferase